MNPDQQRALAATYGTYWPTAEVLLSDDGIDRAKAAMSSGSFRTGDTYGHRYFETTGSGIETYRLEIPDGERYPRRTDVTVAVPWSAVRAHRAEIPRPIMTALRQAWDALHEHSRIYPTAYPDLDVRKVGPNGDLHPDDRGLYHDRMAAYQENVVRPWRAEHRRLEDELTAAVRACLPALDGNGDLLDMLAAIGPEAAMPQVEPSAAMVDAPVEEGALW